MIVMVIVDRHGMPSLVRRHAAKHREVTLVQLSFDFYMIEVKPQNLFGDRAYDSDAGDCEVKKDGVQMISPYCSNGKMRTQERRRLR